MYPAFTIDDLGLGLTPVPEHLPRRADQNLALAAPLWRVDSKFGHGRRLARCPGMLGHELSGRGGYSSAGLGHSVDRRKPAIGSGESAPEPRGQLGLNRSTPKRYRTHGAQVATRKRWMFEHAERHRRHCAPHRDVLALDQIKHLTGVKTALEE